MLPGIIHYKSKGLDRRKHKFAMAIIIPTILLYLILRVIPILGTFYLSLREWSLIKPDRPFVGLANFTKLATDKAFKDALVHTTIYTVLVVIISVSLALLLAIALKEKTRLGNLYEFAYFLPVVIPMVPVSILWKWMYDKTYGIINFVLGAIGLPGVGWLTEPSIALYSIILMSVWKVLGHYMILLLVGLRNIPDEYYEAAAVDGAVGWNVFRHITFPLLKPMLLYVCVIATIQAFNVFTPVYVMTTGSQSAPAAEVRVLVYEIYQNAFRYFKVGYASAQTVILFAIVMIVSILQFRLFKAEHY